MNETWQVGLWCEYVQWVEQHFPKTDQEANILARACDWNALRWKVDTNKCQLRDRGYSLTGDPALKDDIRYLRLWVRHAALLPDPDKAVLLWPCRCPNDPAENAGFHISSAGRLVCSGDLHAWPAEALSVNHQALELAMPYSTKQWRPA